MTGRMTRQTTAPLRRLPINQMSIPLTTLVKQVRDGEIDINPSYQRGDVWTEDQRIALVYSWMCGATIPSITIGDRSGTVWRDTATYDIRATKTGIWACIDGRQRLTTAVMWMNGDFAVPASWFRPGSVAVVEDTADGPYVRYTRLTDYGRASSTDRTIVPTGVGEFASLQEEAAIYVLLNGGGTPQTDADMDNAARVARGE